MSDDGSGSSRFAGAGICLAAGVLAILGGCATGRQTDRGLGVQDLRRFRTAPPGTEITLSVWTDLRRDGRPEVDLWLSVAAHNHAFGPSRADFCVRAEDRSGELQAFVPFHAVSVHGVLRSDPIPAPAGLECPSNLVLSVSSVRSLEAKDR